MILIISVTKSKIDFLQSTHLSKSLKSDKYDFERYSFDDIKLAKASINKSLDILYVYENTLPLGLIYNKVIRFTLNSTIYSHILFIHDDVVIEDRHLENKVYDSLNKFDIIGLAGGDNVSIRKPCLWHIMSKSAYGTVGHFVDGHWYGTTFGPSNKRVTVIDGLFIGVKSSTLREKPSLRFDDKLPGFHHYDIDFCLTANLHKCKIGVVPILTTHYSPGLMSFSDPKYVESENYFLSKKYI